MLLADYNLQEVTTEQMEHYLASTDLSFKDLRGHILSKNPIPSVQSSIITLLTASKTSNQNKVKKALENQAYKNQHSEDEKQKKRDLAEGTKDEEAKRRLNRELKHIPTQLSTYETERRLLQRKLMRLYEKMPPVVDVSSHPGNQLKKVPSTSMDDTARSIERIKDLLLDYESKISKLYLEQSTIPIKIREIERRMEKRKILQHRREKRTQASVGYLNSGQGVEETLSTKNKELLAKSIQVQESSLEKKCDELIQNSEQINYFSFLEALQKQSDQKKLKLSPQEAEAIKTLLKLMKKHLELEHQAANTEGSIDKKKSFINSQQLKLQRLRAQLKLLQNNNPNLTSANQQLITQNKELKTLLAHHTNWRQKLSTPTLLLLGLTFLFAIPFTLTLCGVIPFFLAPALMYSLVSIPPALLLLSTIGVGIGAIVFAVKAYSNDSTIKANTQKIETNKNLMGRNSQNLKTLQTLTIPSLEKQINKDEASCELLSQSLKNLNIQAHQALKQAQEVKPGISSPFLGKKVKSKKTYSYDESSEQSEIFSSEEETTDEMVFNA